MPEGQPAVRPGVAADTAEVLRLATLMYESIGIDASGADWRRVATEHLSERLGQDAAIFVVDHPTDTGRLIATGAGSIARRLPGPANPEAKVGYVQWMSTDPAWRRRGLARQVMLALLEWFRQNDVAVVGLRAAPLGEKLYQDLGFQEGRSPDLFLFLRPRPEPAPDENQAPT
jgi:GNAT superfamily N-acetyltransferase